MIPLALRWFWPRGQCSTLRYEQPRTLTRLTTLFMEPSPAANRTSKPANGAQFHEADSRGKPTSVDIAWPPSQKSMLTESTGVFFFCRWLNMARTRPGNLGLERQTTRYLGMEARNLCSSQPSAQRAGNIPLLLLVRIWCRDSPETRVLLGIGLEPCSSALRPASSLSELPQTLHSRHFTGAGPSFELPFPLEDSFRDISLFPGT